VEEDGRRTGGGADGIQKQKQEPHTKTWRTTIVLDTNWLMRFYFGSELSLSDKRVFKHGVVLYQELGES